MNIETDGCVDCGAIFSQFVPPAVVVLRRTLDGDACRPHQRGCPPQLLQVARELVRQ